MTRGDQPSWRRRTTGAAVGLTVVLAAVAAAVAVGHAPWVDADVPASVEWTNEAVRRAAEAAGATFVDPLAEGWFFDAPELIGDDGIHPTDDGHAYLAERIAPHVQAAISRAPAFTTGG